LRCLLYNSEPIQGKLKQAFETFYMTLFSPTEQILRDLLAKRILILDGAMGTMIQQYKLIQRF
jgi:hypothetical protein